MSLPCSPEHERWLKSAFTEGADALPPAARRAIEACPRCARELRDLGALVRGLEQAGTAEREDLAFATRSAGPREDEFVRRALGLARPAARGRSWTAPLVGALVLAAAVLLFFLLPLRGPAPAPVGEPEVLLGENEGWTLDTSAWQAGFGPLTWTAPMPERVFDYVVRVWPFQGDAALRSPSESTTPRFSPSDAETESWPDQVLLEIIARDAAGTETSRSSWTLQRRGAR